jgi:phosphatidate cytidylyltransferase
MTPPPPAVSAVTTVLCVSIAIASAIVKGHAGMILAVSAFSLLVLNVVTVKKPKFAQLASTVFGLFYCGARAWGCMRTA